MCLLGDTGTMFTGLSAGPHSLEFRFTPAGSDTPSETQSVVFNVDPVPTPCEYELLILSYKIVDFIHKPVEASVIE